MLSFGWLDRPKAVAPVLVLLFVALWFILRGDLFHVLPCVILFLCFLALRLPRLGKRELILVLFVRLFDMCLFRFVGFLFLLVSGKGCGLWLWHSLDFFLLPFVLRWLCSLIVAFPEWPFLTCWDILNHLSQIKCISIVYDIRVMKHLTLKPPKHKYQVLLSILFLLLSKLISHTKLYPPSFVLSSLEQEVLKVSYCDRSMSVVPRPSCGVNNLLS